MERENKSTKGEFLMTRTFDAPRDLVFKSWTERERLMHWWGPKGSTMRACNINLRPGGAFHYGMQAPDGGVMWGKWIFREIVRPERLIFRGFVFRRGWRRDASSVGPGLAAENAVHVESFSEHDGRTTLTAQGVPLDASESERAAFEAGHESMRLGWSGTLDQLAQYLAKA